MAIGIKIIRVPGNITPLNLSDNATVGDALNAAGDTLQSGETAKINGVAVDMSYVLRDGDKIYLAKGAKGNL